MSFRVSNTINYVQSQNVKSFGAKGDGATDDTAAIVAAIASLPTSGVSLGGIVFFPPGKYMFTTFSLPSYVTLLGAGRNSSRLFQILGTASPMVTTTATTGTVFVTIRDLMFTAFENQAANAGGILMTGVDNLLIDAVQVSYTRVAAIQQKGGSGGATSGDAMYATLRDVEIVNPVAGAGLLISPAAAGGSHPDGLRMFGGEIRGGAGIVGIQIDPASADSAGFLAADSCQFYGVDMIGIPTPVSIDGSYHKFIGGRWEVTSGTMTLTVNNTNPTNNPSTANLFQGITLPTYADTTKLIVTDNGVGTAFVGNTWAGSGGWL